MFHIVPKPTFCIDVALAVPGLPAPILVQVTYRYKNKAQLKEFVRQGAGKEDFVLLFELIDSWAGVVDPAGEQVPYTLSALKDLAENHWSAIDELTSAYLKALGGEKTKNSWRLPAA